MAFGLDFASSEKKTQKAVDRIIGRFSMKKFKFRPVSNSIRAVFDKKLQIPPSFGSFIH